MEKLQYSRKSPESLCVRNLKSKGSFRKISTRCQNFSSKSFCLPIRFLKARLKEELKVISVMQHFLQFADGTGKLQLAALQFFHAAAAIFFYLAPALLNKLALQQRFQLQLLFRGATSYIFNQCRKTHSGTLISLRAAVNSLCRASRKIWMQRINHQSANRRNDD